MSSVTRSSYPANRAARVRRPPANARCTRRSAPAPAPRRASPPARLAAPEALLPLPRAPAGGAVQLERHGPLGEHHLDAYGGVERAIRCRTLLRRLFAEECRTTPCSPSRSSRTWFAGAVVCGTELTEGGGGVSGTVSLAHRPGCLKSMPGGPGGAQCARSGAQEVERGRIGSPQRHLRAFMGRDTPSMREGPGRDG